MTQHQPGSGTLAGVVAAAMKAGNLWRDDAGGFTVRVGENITLHLSESTVASAGAMWGDRAKWPHKSASTLKRNRRPLPMYRGKS